MGAMDKKEIRERAIMVLFSKSEGPRQSNKKKNRKKKARAQQPAAEAVATETVEANTEAKESNNNQAGGKPKRGKRRRRRRENNNRRKQQAAPAEEKTEEDAAAGGSQERRVGRNRRVFVKNLAANTTEETLQSVFSSYGAVARVNLPKEKDGDAIRGFAFVTYDQPEDAFKAKQAENVECGGNALQIFWAQPRRF